MQENRPASGTVFAERNRRSHAGGKDLPPSPPAIADFLLAHYGIPCQNNQRLQARAECRNGNGN